LRFLVFQHIAVEHPGVFRDFMRRDGIAWDCVELDIGEPIPDLSRYAALIVMGGPMDVWQEDTHPWLVAEKAAIRQFVNVLGRPFLGICLGHQLLADALGGSVGLMTTPEVGVADVQITEEGKSDPLLQGLASPIKGVQWHGAEIKNLPKHARVLAQNDACPIQALRVGRHAYGLQYHVEVDRKTIAEWGEIPAYRTALERLKGPSGQQDFEQEVANRTKLLHQVAESVYRRFVQLAIDHSRASATAGRPPQ
jgi:GMP synthase-like glutamine amidotransferase